MAFRTNKTPAIEERTVSGSSVSFNSAFALPLKACKVSFSATQAGSGTPSPQNVRPIIPVSSVDLSANSVSVTVPLGDSYGGGNGDILTGNGIADYVYLKLSDLTWTYTSGVFRSNNKFSNSRDNAMCECYEPVSAGVGTIQDGQINFVSQYWDNNKRIIVKDTRYTDVESWLADMGDYKIVYSSTPIELTFTPTPINTILGNNTFSTDTGTLEITFADLQEKSASGSVATFNTALAMPLASCNIAVNAWQEGSGDPSPDNVRPIHGFSEVNVTANNVIHTIQLGQEVYGAEVDVVNGVAHVTHKCIDLGDLVFDSVDNNIYLSKTITDAYRHTSTQLSGLKCSIYNESLRATTAPNYSIVVNSEAHGANRTYIIDDRFDNDITALHNAIIGYKLAYVLATPIDIQLTPQQIETLIGNNTIFADTGDVDLTYKDLDIAKRGNFREVFKLPS